MNFYVQNIPSAFGIYKLLFKSICLPLILSPRNNHFFQFCVNNLIDVLYYLNMYIIYNKEGVVLFFGNTVREIPSIYLSSINIMLQKCIQVKACSYSSLLCVSHKIYWIYSTAEGPVSSLYFYFGFLSLLFWKRLLWIFEYVFFFGA